MPLDVVVTCVRQAASALQYAHEQGITHGDLRPEQMLLRERDRSLLLNGFGLTTLLPILFQQFVPDNPYLAPELPQQAPQPASDQYSLAAIAYDWLSGSSPIRPHEVEQVLNTARAREPGQRFASIRAFATALEQASKSGLVQPVQPPAIPDPLAPALATPAMPDDSTVLRPDPPLSPQGYASQHPPAEVSQVEPNALPQVPARKGISRRRLLTGLAVGGVVVAGIGGAVLLNQRQRSGVGLLPSAALPSPPKLIYTYQGQSLYTDLISDDLDFLWLPDSKRIAVADYRDRTLQIWDAADGGHLITWTAPKNSLYTFHWSRNSLLVAWSVGKDPYTREKIVHVRDVINGRDITTFTDHANNSPESGFGSGIIGIAFSPDGKRIVSSNDWASFGDPHDPPVRVWNAMTGTTICSIDTDYPPGDLQWSPDGRRILSWSRDKILRVWDAQAGTSITAATAGQNLRIAPAWSPNSQYVASTEWEGGIVNVWNAHNGQRVCSYQHQASKDVYSFAWSPDSTRIASAGEGDDRVHVWNAATGRLISTHHDWLFTRIAWSPDGKHIASKGPFDMRNGHSFQAWDATSGANSINYNTPVGVPPGAGKIDWSPDGRFIAAQDKGDSNNNAIYVWQVGWGQAGQQNT